MKGIGWKVNNYKNRAKEQEGKGTHRSIGSNKRLEYLAGVRDCRMQRGKGCRKKSR